MARYWLATFDAESWSIFLGLNPSMLGSKRERADIVVGDIFLNYVRSSGRAPGEWVSVERVTGEPVHDTREIYPAGVWPYRWPVKPVVPRRVFGEGIVGRDLVASMRLFDGVPQSNWGSVLRNQGREIPRPDGELLVRLLSDA